MNNKMYFDVTQLVHWDGFLTGIPRVMNELAVRFSDGNTIFVVWDKHAKCMVEIDFAEWSKSKKLLYKKNNNSSIPFAVKAIKKTSHTLHGKKIRGAGKVEGIANKIQARMLDPVKMQKGDIFFIPWGESWDDNFTKLVSDYADNGVKIVQIIHDMLPLVAPHMSGHSTSFFGEYNALILPKCWLVLTVSEYSKKDVIAWLQSKNLAIPTVKSFRLGDDFSFKQPIKPSEVSFVNSGLKGGDFALVVGTVEIRKNHILAYYTYKLAARKGIGLPKLVIIGRKGWMTEQAYELMTKDPQVKDKFVFIHNGSDENLSWAYENCLYTIYPSMYEGWGLPVAESAVRGVACITSTESSIPEVAGDLVEYVDPYSPDELLVKMAAFNDASVLKKARDRVNGYKTSTWDESYKQVADYLSKDIIE